MSFAFSRRLCLAAALALVPAVAFAHGPSRQKVKETIEIDAPAAKVWEIVGNFGDMSWLPGVSKTEASGGLTPEQAKRKLVLSNGGEIDELLTKYDAAAMTLGYRIEHVDVKVLPVHDYASTITVKPAGDNKSTVEWRGAFYRGFMNNDPPPELNDEAALKAVTDVYQKGLAGLKAKAEGK